MEYASFLARMQMLSQILRELAHVNKASSKILKYALFHAKTHTLSQIQKANAYGANMDSYNTTNNVF